jgi:hypothetical protein
MELLVCAVHPIPGEFYFLWTTKLSNHGGKIGSQENKDRSVPHANGTRFIFFLVFLQTLFRLILDNYESVKRRT